MQALGIGPGDEVITTPFTFVATLNAILEAGATARFADIGDDFNIDPANMARLVNERTRGPHAGAPLRLHGRHGSDHGGRCSAWLAVVEDAAQAVAAALPRPAGRQLRRRLLLAVRHQEPQHRRGWHGHDERRALADRLRLLRNQGMRQRYQYEIAGHNYRLTNLAAAVGLPQLARMETINDTRRDNAAALRAGLADIPGLVLPTEPLEGRTHVYHQFTIRITGDAPITRDEVIDRLTARGIGCGIYYPKVVYDYDCYRSHPGVVLDEVPYADRTVTEVVSLPVHPYLTASELDEIVATVREVLGA